MAVLKYKENNEWKQIGYNVLNGKLSTKPVQDIPVGSIIAFSDDNLYNGWLKCDGSEYLKSDYPELAICKTVIDVDTTHFKVPDLRELVLVGSGHNDVQNIAAHDEYTIGEFKDDQFQGHWHYFHHYDGYTPAGDTEDAMNSGAFYGYREGDYKVTAAGSPKNDRVNGDPRIGTTTHSKQYGIVYYIKAVPTYNININGIDVSKVIDEVINSLDLGSEHTIGKLNNKNVYEKYITVNTPTQANTDVKVADFNAVNIIELSMIISRNDGIKIGTFNCSENDDEAYLYFRNNEIFMHCGTSSLNATATIKIHYTKE